MDARELSMRLAQNAEEVARRLLPGGKKARNEWCVGSINGEPGDSLKVHLDGKKAGIWADFATGEGGDLIDLWQKVRGVSLVEALKQVKQYLGVADSRFEPLPRKTFSIPTRPKCQVPQNAVLEYLTGKRKLTLETIQAFQLGEQDRKIVFPYKRNGELVMWKMVGIDLTADGKKDVLASKDSQPCLFGWQALSDNTAAVVITEGEIDAMTLHQYGWPALSVPFGGGAGNKQQWLEYEYQELERFKDIYLCLDNDEQGQLAVREILPRLGAHRCKVVDLGLKDANEVLKAGLDKDYVDACFAEARYVEPEELKSASVFVNEVVHEFYPASETPAGDVLPWSKTQNLFRMRAAELSIWTGVNGHGKSQLLGHVMLEVMLNSSRVCIASMEIKPRRLLYRLTRQATAIREPSIPYIHAVHEWFGDRLWLFDVQGTAKSDRILEVFRYAAKRYGIKHFVIDSLMKCGIAEDDYRAQKAFVEALTDFKNEFECHVHLVAHSRKGESEAGLVGKLDVKGTGAITDLADNSVSVWRNKAKEDEAMKEFPDVEKMKKPDAILACDKQRNGEWEGKISLWFDKESFQYLPNENEKAKRYVKYSEFSNLQTGTIPNSNIQPGFSATN